MSWIDYGWRLFAKMWALAFVFVGGGLLATVLLPIAMLLPGEQCERAQWLVHKSFRFYIRLLQTLRIISVKIEGGEKLGEGGRIVIANHPSLLDVVILMALIPRVQCIVKHELWNHRTLGILMRRARYIRNDLEPDELLASCREALQDGRTLIIFPEGTRTRPGSLPRFSRGFANIALLTASELVPVYVTCRPSHLYTGEPWWRVPRTRPVFNLAVGDALDVASYRSYNSRGIAARKLLDTVERSYVEKVGYG